MYTQITRIFIMVRHTNRPLSVSHDKLKGEFPLSLNLHVNKRLGGLNMY